MNLSKMKFLDSTKARDANQSVNQKFVAHIETPTLPCNYVAMSPSHRPKTLQEILDSNAVSNDNFSALAVNNEAHHEGGKGSFVESTQVI